MIGKIDSGRAKRNETFSTEFTVSREDRGDITHCIAGENEYHCQGDCYVDCHSDFTIDFS